MKDLYKVLGVSEEATEAEIKKAYRNLAKQYHPDKCGTPECEEKFKEINAANEVLSSEEKRRQYDRVGDSAFGNGGFQEYSQQHHNQDLNDILNQMFGGGGFGGQNPGYGEPISLDTEAQMDIPLVLAINGGKVNAQGTIVTVPKNIKNGQKLRIKGQGRSMNGRTGNLILQLMVQSDELFEVSGNDIHMDLNLNLKEAIFGTTKEIDIYGDKVNMKIPKDTKPDQLLRIKNKGLSNGNVMIHCKIILPKSDTISQEDLDFIDK